MKKRIWKRIGAVLLVCCTVILNILALLFPTSAEEKIGKIYEDYYNLDVDEEADLLNGASDLFDGMSPNQSSNDVLYLNGYRISERSIDNKGNKSLVIELKPYGYYVLRTKVSDGTIFMHLIYRGSRPNYLPSGKNVGDYSAT